MNDDYLKIELPWPPRELSPNAKGTWQSKYPVQQEYKELCFTVVFANHKRITTPTYNSVNYHFVIGKNKRMDLDNLIGAMKYAMDGVCAAIKFNADPFLYLDPDVPVMDDKLITQINATITQQPPPCYVSNQQEAKMDIEKGGVIMTLYNRDLD